MAAGSAATDATGRLRGWAVAGLVGQVVFVAGWVTAPAWQGRGYRVRRDSISDLYAVDAPHAAVLVVVFTGCGLLTIGFLIRCLWPALRPAGWPATVAIVLMSGSIFGLGDLLTPFERLPCRRADAGCSSTAQLTTAGGRVDAVVSATGLVLFTTAWFFLASAARQTPGWRHWHRRSLVIGTVTGVLVIVAAGTAESSIGGLTERALALEGAISLGALAIFMLRSACPHSTAT